MADFHYMLQGKGAWEALATGLAPSVENEHQQRHN